MTTKSPVYHRTSDGRKGVICAVIGNLLQVYFPFDGTTECFHAHELTHWVAPETRTVYVHWWKDDGGFNLYDAALLINRQHLKAIKKITITEGEFDE